MTNPFHITNSAAEARSELATDSYLADLNLTPVEVAVFGSRPAPEAIEAFRYRSGHARRLIQARWPQFFQSQSQPQPQPKRRQRPPLRPGIERISIEQAAAILGPPVRTVQALAARGEISGAAKIGGRWTFDVEKLRQLVRQKERQAWQSGKRHPAAIGAAGLFGAGFRSVGVSSADRFTQLTRRLRGRTTKPGGSG